MQSGNNYQAKFCIENKVIFSDIKDIVITQILEIILNLFQIFLGVTSFSPLQ